jgi:hypothetical protein
VLRLLQPREVHRRCPAGGQGRAPIRDLVRQRLYGIACGYADCNDAARLAEDPIQKLLIGRDPLSGATLASQPTLSRFENAPCRADLYRMGEHGARLCNLADHEVRWLASSSFSLRKQILTSRHCRRSLSHIPSRISQTGQIPNPSLPFLARCNPCKREVDADIGP